MRYILFFLITTFTFLSNVANSQYCNLATTNVAITPTTTPQLSASYNTGRRAFNFVATAGCTYVFETCGYSTADTYLRLYSTGTGGTLLATGDDNCGTQSRITWTCTTNGTYSILMTNFSCAALTVATRLNYYISGCAPVFNPCSSIASLSCGVSTSFVVSSGSGAYNPPSTSCGFTTPGQEKIYQFTPTVSGNYTITQPTSFGYIDWFYKLASSGCSGTGWTCIDDISTGNVGNANVNIPLTAGTTYYIMADPESTVGGTVNFTLNCPPSYNPCTTISTISSCGTTVTSNYTSGTGAYNPPSTSCGFTTPGREIIYQFTAPITGNYTLSQLSSFGFIDYFFKPVSGGCSGTGWTCIDDLSGAMTSVSFNLTSGVTYYIMGDPETTLGGTAQFVINCPTPPPANDNCVNATSITLPYNSGVVSNNGSTDDGPVSSLCGQMGSNLWYTVVGDGQEYIATTCDASTNFDTEIQVFTGVCAVPTEVVCNDDDASCSSSGLRSTVSWCSVPGVQYLISVGYYTTGGGFGNFRLLVNTGIGCSPLPIELLTFTGEPYNDDVMLEWSTATEHNNDYFFIEKSLDGYQWTKIREVDATGNSTVTVNYMTFDTEPKKGINYYRLTQVDFDGQYETFDPIAVNILDEKDCEYEFYNLSGQKIDIENAPTGVYLKKCKDTVTKFVKY